MEFVITAEEEDVVHGVLNEYVLRCENQATAYRDDYILRAFWSERREMVVGYENIFDPAPNQAGTRLISIDLESLDDVMNIILERCDWLRNYSFIPDRSFLAFRKAQWGQCHAIASKFEKIISKEVAQQIVNGDSA